MDEPMYTVQEVAQRFKVTRKAVYDWMRVGKLRFVYIGERRRIPLSAIEAFIRTGGPAPGQEPTEEETYVPGLVAA